ncbi:hypothetical protein [Zavarzinella formosa]|uniref:hypothetical protein n=1 Tax=Zavarzinella formosa TaxID=360055 RepID=UPI0003125D63|nr:hypothetical protein [Zavarzinella formosa]
MRGKWVRLTANRRFIVDLMRAAKSVPTVPVERRMDLGRLKEVRERLDPRPSWAALFLKAYASVARDVPALRRAYVKLPWAHLCEYPVSTVSIAVEREHQGEKAVFFGHIREPENIPVGRLTQLIRSYQTIPVETCREFQRLLRVSRLPGPLRRMGWWYYLNSARNRGNCFGTFALSVYSRPGSQSLHPLSPCTGTLNYGPIDEEGLVTVRLIYDHRVVDGSTVARALEELEHQLNGPLALELDGGVTRQVLRLAA